MKQRNCFLLAALLLVVVTVYQGLSDTVRPVLVGMLLAWSASLLLAGVMLRRGWLSVPWLPAYTTPIGFIEFTALIHFTGGPHSPYFPLLGAIPLVIALFNPYIRVYTLLASVLMVATGVLLDLLAQMPLEELGAQVLGLSVIGLFANLGVETYQRMRSAERAAQHERLTALDQLSQSERRRVHAERERSEVERLALVGQLASGVAHEVNNPLAFVKANLNYLKQELQREDGPQDPEELHEVLEETQQGVLRIQRIITDLRSFSREGHGPEAQGWPESALREAQRLASVRLHSLGEVSLDIPPGLPAVRLGQRHLEQVLVNLLLNAADAVESAVPSRRAHIRVRGRWLDGSVRLEVEDNGPGIPESLLPRIFEPFFSTGQNGKITGLGLALCREYVSRAGGTLLAENRPEGGARFILTLPGGSEPAAGVDPLPSEAAPSRA